MVYNRIPPPPPTGTSKKCLVLPTYLPGLTYPATTNRSIPFPTRRVFVRLQLLSECPVCHSRLEVHSKAPLGK